MQLTIQLLVTWKFKVNWITVTTGTVDGRDVAADGLKLDGIEAGADVSQWVDVTGGINYPSGNVGIGTTIRFYKFRFSK